MIAVGDHPQIKGDCTDPGGKVKITLVGDHPQMKGDCTQMIEPVSTGISSLPHPSRRPLRGLSPVARFHCVRRANRSARDGTSGFLALILRDGLFEPSSG